MLGSVVVWIFGTLTTLSFLAWFISSPEGDPSPPITDTASAVVLGIGLLSVLLSVAAGSTIGAAVVRAFVIATIVVALAALFVLPGESGDVPVPFGLLSFLTPALAFSLVLPAALVGRRDLREGTKCMAGIAAAFVVGAIVQQVSGAGLWISLVDAGGAVATALLAALTESARAAKERMSTSAEEPLGMTPSGPGGAGSIK
jgi:hypothetical protein